ncbi:uncharacterized PurR-regulated membrane protein YhhQ (DUF165 family) [Klebsiella sp. BIGb0407]|nr:uncharacterized PurR-regulated membrane protein YhhQ (DUF165 family) [Klebsiella sp. BIGb0407]
MITCDTLVYKVFDIYQFKITASGIIFSLCFLISTILAEVYGYRMAALLLTSYPISLSGKYSLNQLINIISTTWSYKVIISIILLPIAIWLVSIVKKIEKTDHYDWDESYNPMKVFNNKK